MKKRLLGILLMLVLGLTACGSRTEMQDDKDTDNSTEAASTDIAEEKIDEEAASVSGSGSFADFTTMDLDGNLCDETIFSDYKLTVVNVWATYCGPCLNEMPELGELSREYADKGVRIVGIVSDAADYDGSVNEDYVNTAKALIEETGADYLHIIPSKEMMLNALKDVMYVPTTYFIDSDGNVIGEEIIGAMSKEDWKAVIDRMLQNME